MIGECEGFIWGELEMDISYKALSDVFKALSDETRLRIIDMLSCSELCAGDILESFELSQSTLSYHMKILVDANVVIARRDGLWTRYSINNDTFSTIMHVLPNLYQRKNECICSQIKYCKDSQCHREEL